MIRRAALVLAAVAAFTLGPAPQASAGPYADDMAKCLVSAATTEDRTLLVKWMFSAMTAHPELSSLASISDKQRAELSKSAGELFQRLLLVSCKDSTVQAIKNEGPRTIEYAFQILGQVATRGLFTDPHVSAAIGAIDKYIDKEKIKALAAGAED